MSANTPRGLTGIETTIERYRSKLDGRKRPYGVCAAGGSSEPKPLFVCVSPALSHEDLETKPKEDVLQEIIATAQMAADAGSPCVAVRPSGYGPGSRYMNYGEVEVFEVIADVCRKHTVDRDRIYVYGTSMGGAATWYLASHYPDVFAAAAPSCGYCDYRLWTMAGGRTFHMYPWEKASWKARCAAFLVENLEHTPVNIQHGERDRTFGGGVAVEHSRQMARLLKKHGFDYLYDEVPGMGHDGGLTPERVRWLLTKKKERAPSHVGLVTFDLRHNQSYWVTIEQLIRYGGCRARVDATLDAERGALTVRTRNVRTLSLGPIGNAAPLALRIDGRNMGKVDLTAKTAFRRSAKGGWRQGSFDLSREKRHGVAGGICDLFFENLLFVVGTGGTEEETYYHRQLADWAKGYYSSNNGGVHRGGIPGTVGVDFEIVDDRDLTDRQRKNNNLLFFGTYRSNSALARYEDDLPLKFGKRTVRLCGKRFTGDEAAVFAVFPHPENPERYVAVNGGVTPDAVMNSAYSHMGLLPDYFAYSGPDNLGWGFWGNKWETQ